MPKKYHQSMKDRKIESKAFEKAMKMEKEGFFRAESNSIANMPQEVIYRPFGKELPYMDYNKSVNDTVYGVDEQIKMDTDKAIKYRSGSKY